MARESVKILQGKLDVESLISQLNAALAEEWLAYYQYWIGALVVEGAMRPNVQSEFEEHANEERKHAEMIAKRIIELEGVPVLDPQKWSELARCKYDTPQDFDSVCLLNDNVASERCAILRYQEIADFTNGKECMKEELAGFLCESDCKDKNFIYYNPNFFGSFLFFSLSEIPLFH